MDWDGLADAKTLFPSFTGEEDGYLPTLPDHGPVWQLLNPDGSNLSLIHI